jgi:hypothetical protein
VPGPESGALIPQKESEKCGNYYLMMIGSRFLFSIRDRFPNQKPVQKIRDPIFVQKSISDFQIAIAPAIPINNQCKKFAIRFSYRNRSAILTLKTIREFFSTSDPGYEIMLRAKQGWIAVPAGIPTRYR